jgi:membrane protein DedA with SNARE-associated domain
VVDCDLVRASPQAPGQNLRPRRSVSLERAGGIGPLIHGFESWLLDFINATYDAIEWPGVVLMMAIESACIPLPSEIIMPLAGWMLVKDRGLGWEWLFLAALFGAVGNVLGSLIAYYVGAWGGRPLVTKYGRYLLISHHDMDLADRFFQRWGNLAVFASRLLPVVRTFISLPAGISRMPVWQFIAYSFTGAFIWSLWLAWAGFVLGENWENLRNWMRPADIPIVIVVVALIIWYVYRHVKRAWSEAPEAQEG